MAPILFLVFSLLLHSALGELICEELPIEMCAFSVASSGKRCLVETYAPNKAGKSVDYQCKTSEVVTDEMYEMIETNECINACGLSRMSVGISSDALLEPHFTSTLCSQACYFNCPNIVDLYFSMALGEGVYLPDLCEAYRNNPRRAMTALLSSGAATGPVSSIADAPDQSRAHFDAPAPSPVSV